MIKKTISGLLLICFLVSCTNKEETINNEKTAKEFYEAFNKYGLDSLDKFFSDSVVFINKLDSGLIPYWEEDSKVESYLDLAANFSYESGFNTIKIDSISVKQNKLVVYQTFVYNQLFSELEFPASKKVEEIYFRSEKIQKIVLKEFIYPGDYSVIKMKFNSWYSDFFDINEHPEKELWLANDDPEYIKSVINKYKNYLKFTESLKSTYSSSWDIRDLARESFLNSTYEGDKVMFAMYFEKMEISESESEDDFEDFSTYAGFYSGNMSIFTVPTDQAISVLQNAKRASYFYIYGSVSTFLTGELALVDVYVYNPHF